MWKTRPFVLLGFFWGELSVWFYFAFSFFKKNQQTKLVYLILESTRRGLVTDQEILKTVQKGG